jgi:hypothetical protein
MNMGRAPHRKPSSDPHKVERETGTGKELTIDATGVSALQNLAQAADTARKDLISCGEMNPAARSLGGRRARMDEVRRKIAEGYYDKQEVRQMIADRLADNMNP